MEYYNEDLTNEKLLKRFKSQFQLVDHAISAASHMIRLERDIKENRNIALEVIDELVDHADPTTLREFFKMQAEMLDKSGT